MERQNDDEARSSVLPLFRRQLSAVTFTDPSCNGKTQACTCGLGCIERVEQPLRLGEPRPVVLDADDDLIAVRMRGNVQVVIATERIPLVIEQVDENFLQFIDVDRNGG